MRSLSRRSVWLKKMVRSSADTEKTVPPSKPKPSLGKRTYSNFRPVSVRSTQQALKRAARRQLQQLALHATQRGNEIDGAVAQERQPLAVGRPGGRVVRGRVGGKPQRRSALYQAHVNIIVILVRAVPREGDLLAVWRERGFGFVAGVGRQRLHLHRGAGVARAPRRQPPGSRRPEGEAERQGSESAHAAPLRRRRLGRRPKLGRAGFDFVLEIAKADLQIGGRL